MPNQHRRKKITSIALVANQNEIFYRLRMPWVRQLSEQGYTVYAIAPNGYWSKRIEAENAHYVEWKLSRSGRNPFSEIQSILRLSKILRRLQPDVVQNFHTKPNIYAPIASKLAGVPVNVSTITGLGYTFVERGNASSTFATKLSFCMYKLANKLASEVVFQNPEDMALLRSKKTLINGKGRLIPGGSGVDVSEYNPSINISPESVAIRESLDIPVKNFVALFVGRLQLDKGINDFVRAANEINKKRHDITFVMVGAPDPGNKRSVSKSQLSTWQNQTDIIFTGRREDVPKLMAMANTVIAPTFYREGIPRTLIEGAASGLPLIGTDMPGVREVITDGVNGTLIPTHNPEALAHAVETLADNPNMAKMYGCASLEMARIEFDHRRVVGAYAKMYEELWNNL